MADLRENANYIFTTYLGISSIVISHDNSNVLLFGVYGNQLDGNFYTIEIQTNFQTLYDLLSLLEDQAEEAIDALSNAIANPTEDNQVIDLSGKVIHFYEHIFGFIAFFRETEEGNRKVKEDGLYLLAGYAKKDPIHSDFNDLEIPTEGLELIEYYNSLLSMQYALFLSAVKQVDKLTSLVLSNLTDPTIFALAKAQYELEEKIRDERN
jgi:hypothetical protein